MNEQISAQLDIAIPNKISCEICTSQINLQQLIQAQINTHIDSNTQTLQFIIITNNPLELDNCITITEKRQKTSKQQQIVQTTSELFVFHANRLFLRLTDLKIIFCIDQQIGFLDEINQKNTAIQLYFHQEFQQKLHPIGFKNGIFDVFYYSLQDENLVFSMILTVRKRFSAKNQICVVKNDQQVMCALFALKKRFLGAEIYSNLMSASSRNTAVQRFQSQYAGTLIVTDLYQLNLKLEKVQLVLIQFSSQFQLENLIMGLKFRGFGGKIVVYDTGGAMLKGVEALPSYYSLSELNL